MADYRAVRTTCMQTNTHTEQEGEGPLSEELTPLQKTWYEEEEEEGRSANLNMESESCISHPSYTLSTHYLVISRGMVLKEGGINQLSWVNVLQPHYEPWVAL